MLSDAQQSKNFIRPRAQRTLAAILTSRRFFGRWFYRAVRNSRNGKHYRSLGAKQRTGNRNEPLLAVAMDFFSCESATMTRNELVARALLPGDDNRALRSLRVRKASREGLVVRAPPCRGRLPWRENGIRGDFFRVEAIRAGSLTRLTAVTAIID